MVYLPAMPHARRCLHHTLPPFAVPRETLGSRYVLPAKATEKPCLFVAVDDHGIVSTGKTKMIPPGAVVSVSSRVYKQRLIVYPQNQTEQITVRVGTMPFASQAKRTTSKESNIRVFRPPIPDDV